MKKVESFANKGRFAVINNYKTHIIIYTIFGAISCVYLFLDFEFYRQSLLIGAGIISILYTLPIFGKSMRLRDFSYIKIFLIAIIWAYVTVFIPLYESGFGSVFSGIFSLEIVLFFLAITIPFDIRDIAVDQSNKVNTIPTAIGKKKSIQLSLFLLFICFLFELIIMYLGSAQGVHLLQAPSISMIGTFVITSWLIIYTQNKKDDYYFSGLMDGMIMIPYIILMIYYSTQHAIN